MRVPFLFRDMVHDALHLIGGDERVLDADRFRTSGRKIQHVAVAQELVGPVHVKNRPRVNLRRDLIGNPRREIRFDDARDNVNGRALGGKDKMNSDSARQLCEPCDRFLDLASRRDHQIGKFVNDDNEIREPSMLHRFGVVQPSALEALIVISNIPHARCRKTIVSLFHLDLDAFESKHGVVRCGDDLFGDVRRNGKVMAPEFSKEGKLDLLRINDDKLDIARM